MINSTLPTAVTFDEQSLTIIDRDGMPYLSAADLARALGYSDAGIVSRIYRKHASEFTADMARKTETVLRGTATTAQRIFSPRGCHLIAMFARTPRAEAFRRWVLNVLEGIATPAPRAPKMVTKQQHDLPAPPAFNAELQERIYKRAGALSGAHYTWCVEQMNLQRHLPPVCFNPDTWTPEPHTPEIISDLEVALSVMEVFGKRLSAHHRHLVKLTAGDKPALSSMVAAVKARRAQ